MKVVIPKGATSRILTVFIQANNVTTGAGLGSLTNASSIVGGYVREGGTGVALAVDEDVTTEGTYQAPSAAGKVRIGTPANMRTGTYELHFHNDLWATGAETVTITLGGATNMADLTIEVQLSDPIRGLGAPTGIPNAVAGASGGLIINGSNSGTVTLAALTISGATILTGNVSMAAGLTITQSTSNGSALVVTGNGTGHGIIATSGSGATGDGIVGLAASTNGAGINGIGNGTVAGIRGNSLGTGAGITGIGGASGGDGIVGQGAASGAHGVAGYAGVNAHGIAGFADGSGHGLAGFGDTSGNGIHGEATGSGKDINGDITGNITGTLTTVTNLTNAPTSGDLTAAMKASVNAEVDTALADARLDELLQNDSDIDGAAPPTVGSVFHELMSKTAGSFTFDQTTDSLEAIRDKETDIETDTQDIQSRLPAALVSGRIDASVGAMAANTLTASALATDAREEIADQVWDEAIAGHAAAGSTGEALSAAGSAGDPWTTALPGAYGAGTAGKIVGDNINATISSRSSHSAADVWAVATRTLTAFDASFKTGYALSAAGVQAIWDALTSALTTVGSIGKLLVDNINATISSRFAAASAPSNFSSLGINASGHISRVTLVDTTTTNTDMRGTDNAALAATALSTAQWTNTRAGYLDNLNSLKIKKNTAYPNFSFLMVLSSDHITPATGKTVTAQRLIDGGSFAACANSVVEDSNGVYHIDLAAADLNGDAVTLKFTNADCDQRTIVIAPQP